MLTRYVMSAYGANDTKRCRGYVNRYEIHRQLTKTVDSKEHRFSLVKNDAELRLICHFFDGTPNWEKVDPWFLEVFKEMRSDVLDTSFIMPGAEVRLAGDASSYLKKYDNKDVHVGDPMVAGDLLAAKLSRHGLDISQAIVTGHRRILVAKNMGEQEFYLNAYDFVAQGTCTDCEALSKLLANGIGKQRYLGLGMTFLNAYKAPV